MPTATLPAYVRADEAKAARRIVRTLLGHGYALSVHDGEETTVRRSTDLSAILPALASTEADTLIAYMDGERVGSAWLVWGNGGEDLIADWSWVDATYAGRGRTFKARMDALLDALIS